MIGSFLQGLVLSQELHDLSDILKVDWSRGDPADDLAVREFFQFGFPWATFLLRECFAVIELRICRRVVFGVLRAVEQTTTTSVKFSKNLVLESSIWCFFIECAEERIQSVLHVFVKVTISVK